MRASVTDAIERVSRKCMVGWTTPTDCSACMASGRAPSYVVRLDGRAAARTTREGMTEARTLEMISIDVPTSH